MARNGLARMDVDTHWASHRKVRRLQQQQPDRWPIYWCAYMALLGDAWASNNRLLTVTDAWHPALPSTPAEATAALVAAGVTDKAGRIPAASWAEWHGPAEARVEAARAAAGARWHPTPAPAQPAAPKRQRRSTPRTDSGPTAVGLSLRQMGFYPPGEQPPKDEP